MNRKHIVGQSVVRGVSRSNRRGAGNTNQRNWIILLAAILIAALWWPCRADEEAATATDWTAIRGINFIPGYARNAYETWARYDAAVTARELGFFKGLGFNSVRLWLHSDAYFEDPRAFLNSMEDCLDTCRRLGLTAMPVLFDACGIEPAEDARVMSLRSVFEDQLDQAKDEAKRTNLLKAK